MGDKIIITEDEDKPKPDVIVVAPDAAPKQQKIVTEKTTIVETREE